MEDLFKDAGITSEKEKKQTLGKYADTTTEEEWEALEHFEKGSWSDYVKEIITNYPDAAYASEGTIGRLNQVCKEHSRLGTDDLKELLELKRGFQAEAKKLLKPPACISNRELVEKFLGCLNPDFAAQVVSRLSLREMSTREIPVEEGEMTSSRRKDDRYALADVMKSALDVAEGPKISSMMNSANARDAGTQRGTSTSIKLELDDVKQNVVHLMDRITVNEKTQKQGFEDVMRALQQSNHTGTQTHMPPRPDSRQGYSAPAGPPGACHYCWKPGHYVADCPDRHIHIDQGKVKVIEGRMRLADGSLIPREPTDKCQKDRVEMAWANKKQAQLYMREYEEDAGFLPLVNSNELSSYSLFTNQVKDKRDEIIAGLKGQLYQLQNSRTPVAPTKQLQQQNCASREAVPEKERRQFDPEALTLQIQALSEQLSQSRKDAEYENFISTRSRQEADEGGNKQGF